MNKAEIVLQIDYHEIQYFLQLQLIWSHVSSAYKNIREFKTLIDDELLAVTCSDLQKDTQPKALPKNARRASPPTIHQPSSSYDPNALTNQHFPFRFVILKNFYKVIYIYL